LLGGDHRQRATVELTGGPSAVDELPQPGDRRFGLMGVAESTRSAPRVPSLLLSRILDKIH
jgi:hypothetical protein